MKITETTPTPPPQRTFVLELGEDELRTLYSTFGASNHLRRLEYGAPDKGGDWSHDLFNQLGAVLDG